MNESAQTHPLRRGRGLRVIQVRMVLSTGESEEYIFDGAATTALIGPANSSKTTTLNVIDYCLGDRDSVGSALGAAIEEKYLAVATEITIDGAPHRLTREFAFGRRGRILVDETLALSPPELSDWLLQRLGWPRLSIPLGRNPATATQLTTLSFRSCLRHIYRKEDSWTEFANKEEEFLRRAVVSLFLGFAPSRYETAEYELGRAQREVAGAEAVHRDVLASTDEAVGALVTQLNLPPVIDITSLGSVQAELAQRLGTATAERDELTARASQAAKAHDQETPGLDPDLPEELERAASEAAAAAQAVASLQELLSEHEHSKSLVEGDLSRLQRLSDAVDAFDDVPVRLCPACEQIVDPGRFHNESACYLCSQPVSGDIRKRRAEREQRSLQAELIEIAEAIARTRTDLEKARRSEEEWSERRRQLANKLHDARVSSLAPFMAALEDVSTDIGRIRQQIAAIPALRTILMRRAAALAAVQKAQSEVERLRHLADQEAGTASDATDRCAAFADRMNEFLSGFRAITWSEGPVTISAEDLTFYVGTRPWNEQLGAENKVLFFQAYNYALLHLTLLQDKRTCSPGVLMLDNPFQQGLSPVIVVDAIERLAALAERSGSQLIIAQHRDANRIRFPHAEIHMAHEYAV